MTALNILLVIGGIVLFVFIGYYLWSVANEKYNYNIFNMGVIIRGLLSGVCLFLSGAFIDSEDGSAWVWLILAGILWLWTFITTTLKTNFLIGLFSIIYQFIAVFLIRSAIKKTFNI